MLAVALTPLALVLIAFCILTETAMDLGFKHAVETAQRQPSFVGGLVANRVFWLTIALGAIEAVAWILTLQRAPLGVAYPAMTLAYATVPLAGVLFLGERMSRSQMAGAALIAAGVILVGVAGGRP